MNYPHRFQFLPRRQRRVRCIPSQGSNGWGGSYTLMNQPSQPETATQLLSSRLVTRSSLSAPLGYWMGKGNSLLLERYALRLLAGCNGYDSCITCISSQRRSTSSGVRPCKRILASAKSTLCTAGIKYPGQWFALDEARSTRRPSPNGAPPFRHYLSQRRMQLDAPQH